MDPIAGPVSHSTARAGRAASASWPDSLQQQALEFVWQWVAARQGSPAELIGGLEEETGLAGAPLLAGVLEALRAEGICPWRSANF